jgi:HSP20 family protein
MIIVNLKPALYRSNSVSQDRTGYYISGLANWHLIGKGHIWRPPTDVFETEDKIVVRVEIAGMQDGDISINFDQHILSIHGTRTESLEKRAFHQMEIFFGDFDVDIEVNIPIEVKDIQAQYHDGFLRVFLPKAISKQINIDQD